ncbi:MAG: alcohol dehydrogenase catalytic domain-containing protein [Planctomycetota bacterium]|jgi:threonine dehydrogenase-like Zn-dependent dehydrogenase
MKQAADESRRRASEAAGPPMRALRFDGTAPRLETNHPQPFPERGEALIRTVKAAVSAIDLELCRGLFDFVGTLGHEFIGVVESVNGDQRADLVGKRVVGSVDAVCGRCDMCLAGLSNHCRHRTVLGMRGRAGCLADWLVLPVSNLAVVPDSVDDDQAVFVESLAAAIQAARQLTIEGKPYITVVGDGSLGLLIVQVMAKLNASVRLIGRYSEKLALCEKWGIKHRHVDDIGRRADQDIVVDCTGSATGLELAMRLVRPRGTIVLKTMFARHPGLVAELDLSPIVMREITLLGSRSGPISEAVSMLARGEVDVVSLISRRMRLNDGPAVLQAAAQPGVIKVLVET